ncbi:hypothetical protein CTA1_2427, partial [Colletotrichum tanaceti]
GCSFLYEDDRTTITNGHAVDLEGRPAASAPPPPPPRGPAKSDEYEAPSPADLHESIRAWLSGVDVVADEADKPLVADVLYALGGLSNADPAADGEQARTRHGVGGVGRTNVKVHTMGPGFVGRAPPFASSEFFANAVVVAILLLFAPGFTILAAGVFVTSRVAERWAGQDE